MEKQQAIARLEKQRSEITGLKQRPSFVPEFKKWYRDTEIAIQKIFGGSNRHLRDFTKISYSLGCYSSATPDSAFYEAYIKGLNSANAILSSFIDEINEYGIDTVEQEVASSTSSIDTVDLLCSRFHNVVRQLRHRHADRTTIEIEDEYDVQDLFHSLLTIYFDDIRDEEWTPSHAGACSRVDFLLKQEKIVIELKKTRKGLAKKEIGDQLLIDIQRYKEHPDCENLICFVYDPEARIVNPRGLENDLTKTIDGLNVKVIIRP